MANIKINDFEIASKTITESDVANYIQITGHQNPLYINQEYIKHTSFTKNLVPEGIIIGQVSKCLGMNFPGPGSIYCSQEFQMLKPLYVNETLFVKITCTELNDKKKFILGTFKTECFNQDNELIMDGVAIVIPKKEKNDEN